MRQVLRPAAVAAMLGFVAQGAAAEGDPTRRAERLELTEIDAASGFSIREYDLETGVYYRWRIVGDGLEEYEVAADDLFDNSWIEKVSVEDVAMAAAGLGEIQLGGEAEVDVWFVPIRPGDYAFAVKGREGDDGFAGVMHVR
jgi:hypothetical protein